MSDVRDERGTGGLEKLKKAAPGMTPGRPEIMTRKNASTVGITGGFYFLTVGVIAFLLVFISAVGDLRVKAIIQIFCGIITMLFFGFCL